MACDRSPSCPNDDNATDMRCINAARSVVVATSTSATTAGSFNSSLATVLKTDCGIAAAAVTVSAAWVRSGTSCSIRSNT
jgi:hypothetical protein